MNKNNLGIAPTLVIAIVSAVIKLSRAGYSYYDSLQQARKQQREQRYLEDQEMEQLAHLLVAQFPSVTFSEWLAYVKMTNLIYPPVYEPPTNSLDWKKYAPYAIIALIVIWVVTKK